MKIGYRRPNKYFGMAKQEQSLLAWGAAQIHDEAASGLIKRDWLVTTKVRPAAKDEIGVARLFVLAEDGNDLRAAISQAHRRKAVIVETDTGRRSDCRDELLAMFQDASLAYAGKWLSPERAAELGKLGADASPVTKKSDRHMPPSQAQKFFNNHKDYPTLAVALAAINRDRRFRGKWSRSRIYREEEEGNLKLIPRVPGRAQREYE